MVTFEVNGRTYNIRDYMTLETFDKIKEDETVQGIALLHSNLIDADGNAFPCVEAMKAVLPIPDIAGIRKKIWQVNGLKIDTDDGGEETDPLPAVSDSDTA